MSKSAKKRSLPPPTPPRDKEGSGRFAIGSQGPRPATVLPPAGSQTRGVPALEALPLLEIDLDAQPEPQRGIVSGVFGSAPQSAPADAELDEAVASLHAYYKAHERKHERAELVIEDLSLRLDNPYAASSLVPPPKKPFPVAKAAGIAAALIALGSGAWFVARTSPSHTAPAVAPIAAPVQSSSVAVAPTAAEVAQPVAVAPTAAEVAQPVAVAPKSVAPKAAAANVQQVEAASAPHVAQAPRVAQAPAATAARVVKPAPPAKPVREDAPAAVEAAPVAQSAQASDDNVAQAALRAALGSETPEPAAAAEHAVAEHAAPAAASEAPSAEAEVEDLGALPEAPSREDVIAGFEKVRDALATCAAGKHGVVEIDATIASSGRVSRSLIAGVFQGTPEGSCMARAARTARFPQFSQPSLNVTYPVSL
jgi:hypothetical protein